MEGNGSNSNGASPGMGWAQAAARRKAIRQTMTPIRVKHNIQQMPTIRHTQDGTGTQPPRFGSQTGSPKFGVGGGFKAGGF